MVCAYPRASPSTYWKIQRAEEPAGSNRTLTTARRGVGGSDDGVVELGAPVVLESVSHGGRGLRTNSKPCITSYGNEWRVFGGAPATEAPPPPPRWGAHAAATLPVVNAGLIADVTAVWSFVDSQWADDEVAAARRQDNCEDAHVDAGQLLADPVLRAEHDLLRLEEQGNDIGAFAVLERVYPLLRAAGMHKGRRFRRICESTDVDGSGTLPLGTFQGCASNTGIRFKEKEIEQLQHLLAPQDSSHRSDAALRIDYRHFFALMSPSMPEVRQAVVRDAYSKLEKLAPGGFVEVAHIQRNWNPGCHPEVQRGELTESDAMMDFLGQWDVVSADGVISYEEFLDYYRDVSMVVENDEVFLEIVRCGWDL